MSVPATPSDPSPRPAAGITAAALAAQRGDALPTADSVPPQALDLVQRTRDLVDAVVRTGVPADRLQAAAGALAEVTDTLRAEQREEVVHLVRHADGRIEHLTQAGSGRLNPQAPPLVFHGNPRPPADGEPARPVEVHATCTLTAAHGGPPDRAHGGVVATLLDELLGVAMWASGGHGMTAGLDVRYRAGTPYGVPLDLAARCTGQDGRKTFVSGEIRADGTVTAQARAVFVSARPPHA